MSSYIIFCALLSCVFGNIYHRGDKQDLKRSNNETATLINVYHNEDNQSADGKSAEDQKEIDEDTKEASDLDARRFMAWFRSIVNTNQDYPQIPPTDIYQKIPVETTEPMNIKQNNNEVTDTNKEIHTSGISPRRNTGAWSQHLYNKFVLPKFTNEDNTSNNSSNINEAINKLIETINELNNNIKAQRDKAYLVLEIPRENLTSLRGKRDVITKNITEDGRRSSNELNYLLFRYFSEMLEDLQEKMVGLAPKDKYYNENAFKIGYLIAYLDILENNITRYRKDIEDRGKKWGDSEIVHTFDTLKIHHNTITKLINSLRYYLGLAALPESAPVGILG